ncbi:MAG: hypothetical protein J7L66_02255 [Anaerolineaceae bacterium]|nr:hypothetical protein [Anaerolineaceae bacterium]
MPMSEAEIYWIDFLSWLVQRDLYVMHLIIRDNHGDFETTLEAVFTSVLWKCWHFYH